jgi:hypothetical protein
VRERESERVITWHFFQNDVHEQDKTEMRKPPKECNKVSNSRSKRKGTTAQSTKHDNGEKDKIVKKAKTPEDEYDALGKTVAAKMRKMNEYQRIFADKLINDVLFKGLLEQLTQSTQILNNAPQPWLQFQQQFSAGAPCSLRNWSSSSSSAPVSETQHSLQSPPPQSLDSSSHHWSLASSSSSFPHTHTEEETKPDPLFLMNISSINKSSQC